MQTQETPQLEQQPSLNKSFKIAYFTRVIQKQSEHLPKDFTHILEQLWADINLKGEKGKKRCMIQAFYQVLGIKEQTVGQKLAQVTTFNEFQQIIKETILNDVISLVDSSTFENTIKMSTTNIAVIDNGTGYTKIGYAGNFQPNFVLPTAIAERASKSVIETSKMSYEMLDFHIGEQAQASSDDYIKKLPMGSGTIQDWDSMEKYWHRLIFNYMRCDPEYFKFILTEPPLNPPENREKVAEIFFQTFGVEGLYIGVQAVLALYGGVAAAKSSQNTAIKESDLTGTVVDSGDGVTHVIPIADGYVIGTCIKHIPLAGRQITKFIEQQLKERKENIPFGEHRFAAQKIKQKYSYLAKKNIVAELNKFDQKIDLGGGKYQQNNMFQLYEGRSMKEKKPYQCWVGYQRFLGPEMFFHPQFVSKDWRKPLDEIIDNAIQSSPIDVRRRLYKNIVLSGGSTTIKNLDKRLQRQIQKRADSRLQKSFEISGMKSTPIEVNILQSISQKYAVWLGGSLLGAQEGSASIFKTREDYLEYGPSIARHNPVFTSG